MLTRATCALSAVAVLVAAVWALAPTRPSGFGGAQPSIELEAGVSTAVESLIDWTAFDVALWQPFPVDAVDEPASPRPTQTAPLSLELLAIATDEDQGLSAVLYDPGTHKIHRARAGSVISQHRIALIDAAGVDVEFAGRTQRLSLQREAR